MFLEILCPYIKEIPTLKDVNEPGPVETTRVSILLDNSYFFSNIKYLGSKLSLILMIFLSRICIDLIILSLSINTNLGHGETTSKKSIMKKKELFYIFNQLLIFSLLLFMLIPNTLQANNVKNSAVIFMYHKFDVSQYPSTNITLKQFEEHLQEFSNSKYNVKSLDYIVDIIVNNGDLPDNTIGISVDDADRSFLTKAWPLLKKNGFPVTLFVSTNTISKNNKKYPNWDEIRQLKNEGVTIGAHSHNHEHMSDLNIDELNNAIETSNKVFLKEIGEIPDLFAYPYGETDKKMIELLKDYKFKVAFGQHSGVVNETSNLYYLPRFSLNEKYGHIDRVKFAATSKGLGVYDFVPLNPHIFENPPFIGFSLLDQMLIKNINCFVFDNKGQVELELFKFNERVEIRLLNKLSKGRSRLNCTVKDKNNNWRWFGHQFYF